MNLSRTMVVTAIVVSSATAANAQTAKLPNPAVEAAVARELEKLEAEVRLPYKGSETDDYLAKIAIALARLGRHERALQTVKWMRIDDSGVGNGTSMVRSDVLRQSVRRQALLGNVEHAAGLADQIQHKGFRADAYLTLARAYLRNSQFAEAKRYLFQTMPLVQKRPNVWPYVAYLFAKSGDWPAASRLFSRAETEFHQPLKMEEQDYGFRRLEWNQEYLAYYRLKSGIPAEQDKGEAVQMAGPGLRYVKMTVRGKRLEKVLAQVRAMPGEAKAHHLINIAVELWADPGAEAWTTELLQEADVALEEAVKQAKPAQTEHEKMRLAFGTISMMSAYRLVGEDGDATRWKETALKLLPADKAAFAHAYYVLTPFVLRKQVRKVTPPLAEVQQAAAELKPHLPGLIETDEGYGFVLEVVQAQMELRDFEAAKSSLEWLEKFALHALEKRRRDNAFNNAVGVAQRWKAVGENGRAQQLLKRLVTAPGPEILSPYTRATSFIHAGFINEGRTLLAKMPMPKFADTYGSLAYAEAKYHPERFPVWFKEVKAPRSRLSFLVKYAEDLTNPFFRSGDEYELVLTENGRSTSRRE